MLMYSYCAIVAKKEVYKDSQILIIEWKTFKLDWESHNKPSMKKHDEDYDYD